MFRHRILDAFQEYPPFQSATKSSFSDLCYSSRCHAHKTNKLQVERLLSTCSLFWLYFLLAAHGNTRLTAVITGEQCQRVMPPPSFLWLPWRSAFPALPPDSNIPRPVPMVAASPHRRAVKFGQLAKVPLVIMSRNDQIFRICTAGNRGRQYPLFIHCKLPL